MRLPPQGFRHAATLLLSNRVRAIPRDASPASLADALNHLAADLVALADDTRVSSDAAPWLLEEFGRTLDRLPDRFDVAAAKETAARVLARVGTRAGDIERRDLFLIYVPEDRLPIAAPLAIELTKRRVSVAFAGYEVASPEQLAAALNHGATHHAAGVVLWTSAFERAQLTPSLPPGDRVRILKHPEAPSTVQDLLEWHRGLCDTPNLQSRG